MKMNYFVFGTNDIGASTRFYDSLFEHTGFNQIGATDRMVFWHYDGFTFAIAKPFNEEEATHGNGTMVGFNVGSNEKVVELHKRAIELGGTSEGEPGQRGPKFSAYVRDLDQNKICFFE